MKNRSLRSQRGITMLMVLLLMTAMLMGALALARITEAGVLVSGNVATKNASVHAAEVGRGVAFAALQALATPDANTGAWYWATQQPVDAVTRIPTGINYDAAGAVAGGVGRFQVNYSVERLCNVNVVTDSPRQCLVMLQPPGEEDPNGDSVDKGWERKDYIARGATQFRITVRVTDTRGLQTWTQTLATLN
jgi:hypothetical protein